jgi:hypothetical protein
MAMTDRTDNPSSQSVDRESHDYRFMVWIALVASLSAALAGSYGWSLASVHESSETEKLLADYTFWLMLFTAILAVATIGLGIATVGLYLTGEKQIGLLHKQFVATHRPKVVVRFIQGPAKTEGRWTLRLDYVCQHRSDQGDRLGARI